MDPDRRMRASSSLRSLAKRRSWKSACVRNRLQLHTRIGIKHQRWTESKDSAQSAFIDPRNHSIPWTRIPVFIKWEFACKNWEMPAGMWQGMGQQSWSRRLKLTFLNCRRVMGVHKDMFFCLANPGWPAFLEAK